MSEQQQATGRKGQLSNVLQSARGRLKNFVDLERGEKRRAFFRGLRSSSKQVNTHTHTHTHTHTQHAHTHVLVNQQTEPCRTVLSRSFGLSKIFSR